MKDMDEKMTTPTCRINDGDPGNTMMCPITEKDCDDECMWLIHNGSYEACAIALIAIGTL